MCFYVINLTEGFETNGAPRCPNLLIQKGKQYYLYNTKLKEVPGVNPIVFNDLKEYTTFLDWQKNEGITCPVLYLQQSYNSQGESEYKIRPNTTEPQGGLPVISSSQLMSSSQLTSTNNNQLSSIYSSQLNPISSSQDNSTLIIPQPSFSNKNPPYPKEENPNEYYLWKSPKSSSVINKYADPMSKYWKGASYTQNKIDKGYYSGNEVNIYVP
jgi:hypothetical protein